MRFEKQAPTVSYGAHADDLFTTLRRAPDAEPGDQVLVLTKSGQAELEPAGTWDTLGMRGTCSPGFVVRAQFAPEQVLRHAVRRGDEPVDGAALAHPVVARVARYRHRSVRARARVRARERASASRESRSRRRMRLSHVMAELSAAARRGRRRRSPISCGADETPGASG